MKMYLLCLTKVALFTKLVGSLGSIKATNVPLANVLRWQTNEEIYPMCMDKKQSWYPRVPTFRTGVNDIVAVRQSNGCLKSTPMQARIARNLLSSPGIWLQSWYKDQHARLYVNDRLVENLHILLDSTGMAYFERHGNYRNPCIFQCHELTKMKLLDGKNNATLEINGKELVKFSIYLLSQNDKLVITDIDGTITKSSFRGALAHVMVPKYEKWLFNERIHSHVVEFLNKVSNNGYMVIYLTANSMALRTTKELSLIHI